MAENDKKAFFFIHAIDAAFNFNMEFFSFFFGIMVFLDKNFRFIWTGCGGDLLTDDVRRNASRINEIFGVFLERHLSKKLSSAGRKVWSVFSELAIGNDMEATVSTYNHALELTSRRGALLGISRNIDTQAVDAAEACLKAAGVGPASANYRANTSLRNDNKRFTINWGKAPFNFFKRFGGIKSLGRVQRVDGTFGATAFNDLAGGLTNLCTFYFDPESLREWLYQHTMMPSGDWDMDWLSAANYFASGFIRKEQNHITDIGLGVPSFVEGFKAPSPRELAAFYNVAASLDSPEMCKQLEYLIGRGIVKKEEAGNIFFLPSSTAPGRYPNCAIR